MPSAAQPPPLRETVGPLAGFLSLGLFWGGFASLQPELLTDLDISDSAMGTARFTATAGAIAGLVLGGVLADRLGRRAIALSALVFAAAGVACGAAETYTLLISGLVVAGVASGSLDVGINTATSALDAAGRNVISIGHALFSAGILIGGAGVGLARDADLERLAISIGLSALMAAAIPLNLRRGQLRHVTAHGDGEVSTGAIGAEHTATGRATRPLPGSMPVLVTLGVLGALAFVVEGAIGSWSAVHIERTLHASPTVSGWGPGIVGLSMITGRLLYQRFMDRRDPLLVLAAGSVLCTLGVVAAATASTPVAAIASFGIAGLGVSVAGPIVYGLAGRSGRANARGRSITVVTTIAYLGLLSGPAAVGIIADATSLGTALLWLAPVSIATAAGAMYAQRGGKINQ